MNKVIVGGRAVGKRRLCFEEGLWNIPRSGGVGEEWETGNCLADPDKSPEVREKIISETEQNPDLS